MGVHSHLNQVGVDLVFWGDGESDGGVEPPEAALEDPRRVDPVGGLHVQAVHTLLKPGSLVEVKTHGFTD